MKANELRIGNYVNETIVDFENGGVKQRPTKIDGHRIKCIESGDIVYGITLTNELLLLCGFVFNEDSRSYRVFSNERGEWILAAQQSGDKTLFKIGLPIDYRQDQYMTNFIHLHQLQNLYFAITGEELEVKL